MDTGVDVMKKLDRAFNAKWKVILSTIIFVVFVSLVLPRISILTTESIGISESPDTSFSFDSDRFYEMVEDYGEEGRTFYVQVRWTFDVIWPLVYGVFLISTTLFFSSGLKSRKPLVLLPILAVGFDFLENIFATIVMTVYPKVVPTLFFFLKLSSMTKWGTLFVSFIIIIILLIRYLLHKKNNQMNVK